MLGAVMSRHGCWNCDYRLEGDPSRCPRCGMPLAGLDARQPAAASSSGAGPARTASPRRKTGTKPQPTLPRSQPKAEIIAPGEPLRSTASRVASGACKGLRVAASGAGRGLLASLGIARKSVVQGAALSVRTAKLVGSAASGVASGVRGTGTRLVAYQPDRATRPRDDVLRHENIRTITDVAERLLREARDENARLAERVATLEAAFATERRSAGKASASSKTAASAPAGRKKPNAARPAVTRVERSQRREPEAGVRPVITLEGKAEPAMAAKSGAAAPGRPARRKAATSSTG